MTWNKSHAECIELQVFFNSVKKVTLQDQPRRMDKNTAQQTLLLRKKGWVRYLKPMVGITLLERHYFKPWHGGWKRQFPFLAARCPQFYSGCPNAAGCFYLVDREGFCRSRDRRGSESMTFGRVNSYCNYHLIE